MLKRNLGRWSVVGGWWLVKAGLFGVADGESSALAWGGGDFDLSVFGGDDGFGKGETDANAGGAGILGFVEAVENVA